MATLPRIKHNIKSGEEVFLYNGKNIGANLLDFWKWSISDLVSNATRGALAEFIVAKALDIDTAIPRDEWQAYDLETASGIKVEVKSSAYLQSWYQKDFSKISFSIRKSKAWNPETNKQAGEQKRQADVYVFALLDHKHQATLDPLKLEQWSFYVVPTRDLDNYERNKTSITLKSLEKMAEKTDFKGIRERVENS